MHLGAIASLAARSLLNRRFSALLTLLAVAVSVLLFVGVEKIKQGAREGFARTISGADLIVGAPSAPINLVLFSIFHIGDATANISWETAQQIAAREDVAWTIPIALGDSHQGFRVVGTSQVYFDRYQYGSGLNLAFAKGRRFEDLHDVVLGAAVARALDYAVGDEIVISHGLGEHSFSHHDDKPFTVTGVLAPTGTPVDRSLHVSLAAIESIHADWQGAAPPGPGGSMAERLRDLRAQSVAAEETGEDEHARHAAEAGHDSGAHDAANGPEPRAITAMIVGLKDRSAVLRVQRELNTNAGEPLLAAIPAIALAQLWQIVGVVERTLAAISACVVLVGLIVILVSILTALNERRREMAILRSVGARPGDIFFLLVAEAALLAFAGSLIGLVALYGALAALEPAIQAEAGVSLSGLRPGLFDLAVLGGVTLAAALLAALPGWRAFRNTLADGLSIRV